MDDPARPSVEKFRQIYELSFQRWSGLYAHAINNPTLPASCFHAFQQQPYFPHNLKLKHVQYANHSLVYATGSTMWDSSQSNCPHGLPSFQQQVDLQVAVKEPISLSVAEEPESKPSYASWFAQGDLSHFPALVLAWAYILAARWAEVMPGECSLTYTSKLAADIHECASQRPTQGGAFVVDIGEAEVDEARWWAAVLAPGEGWQACMLLEQDRLLSPWSISLQTPHYRLLSRTLSSSPQAPLSCAVASFTDAIRFLYKFCVRHNILDQAHAALFAAVLLPSLGYGKTTQLLTSKASNQTQPAAPAVSTSDPPAIVHHDGHLDNHWPYRGTRDFDKLLTLSCNRRGIRAMLLSVFYEPSVECNEVTPWLQGATTAIDSLASDRPDVLGRMFMERLPEVSPLWLGATVLGLQKSLLQRIRYGNLPIDLHSAVWSGTVQSFLQLPVSIPTVDRGLIKRADECRLLFLAQSKYHTRVPICQWKPFGATPADDTDIEVRMHMTCNGHGLQYQGILWNCVDGVLESQVPDTPANQISTSSAMCAPGDPSLFPTTYEGLNYDEQQVSENTTRSILTWLRFDGCAQHEKDIWKHEWFDILNDSDDYDNEDPDEKSDGYGSDENKRQMSSLRVQQWMSVEHSK